MHTKISIFVSKFFLLPLLQAKNKFSESVAARVSESVIKTKIDGF